MGSRLLLGVDIGTQSAKGVLVTLDGRIVATARHPHRPSQPRPGHFEQDADGVWWHGFRRVCRELLADEGVEPSAVAAVGVSGIGPCLLPADLDGTPLRPAILYGIDTRATAEATWLDEHFGASAVRAMGRSPLTSQAVGPKLLWLRRHEPQVWERTARVFTTSSYLVHRLTGEYVLDHYGASGVSPFYDVARHAWNDAWISEVLGGLPMPALRWASETAGHVSAAAADQTGLPAGIPVSAGTGDAAAEAVGVGVRRPGDLMITYGSTTVLLQVVSELPRHTPLWGVAFVRPTEAAVVAGMATSGIVARWLRDLFGGADTGYADLSRAAAAVPAGSRGLVALPYFAGERTPLHDPDARGMIAGLSLAHGRAELYRAVLEATAFGIRHNIEAMTDHGMAPRRVVAVGGGTEDDLWPRIVSAVTGLPQRVAGPDVGAAYGDTILAGMAAGFVGQDVEEWHRPARTVEPAPADGEVYELLYPVYRRLYEANVEQLHTLASLQQDGRRHPG